MVNTKELQEENENLKEVLAIVHSQLVDYLGEEIMSKIPPMMYDDAIRKVWFTSFLANQKGDVPLILQNVKVTKYSIGNPDENDALAISVNYAGKGKWKVSRIDETLNKNLEWEWEMQPSSRTPEYLENNRYDTAEEAIKQAASWLGLQAKLKKEKKNA